LLATAHMQSGAMDRGVRELEDLVRDAPTNLEARAQLAIGYNAQGDPAAALSCLNVAARLATNSPLPCLQLAQLHLSHSNTVAAVAAYRMALRRDPEHPVALNNLASLLLDEARLEPGSILEALELATEAHRLFPDNPVIADTLGWACFRDQKYGRAIELLTQAARRLGNNPSVHYHLAEALYADGKHNEAALQLETALAASGTFTDAQRYRTLLAHIRGQPAPESTGR
jgi:tetratricopeptide (TPR) repeat protein